MGAQSVMTNGGNHEGLPLHPTDQVDTGYNSWQRFYLMTEQKEPEWPGSSQEEGASSPEVPEAEEADLLGEQLSEALREKDQFRALAQRTQADLINYKQRAMEERESLRQNANAQLLLKMLSIVDDFNRALDHVPGDAVAPGWLEGLLLVQRNVEHVLDSEGVRKIEAEGQVFEPREHEAVFYEETPDCEEDIVTKVVRDGYMLHQRVLRAAQVVVSKSPEQRDESENTNQEAQ